MTITSLPYARWRLLNYLDHYAGEEAPRLPHRALAETGACLDDLADLARLGFITAAGAKPGDLYQLLASPGRASIFEHADAFLTLTDPGQRWVASSPFNRALRAIQLTGHRLRGAPVDRLMVDGEVHLATLAGLQDWGLITVHDPDGAPFRIAQLGDGSNSGLIRARLTDRGRQLITFGKG